MQHSIQFEFPIFDLRSLHSYTQRHLINSANIPLKELKERTHELPEKNVPINIVGYQHQIDQAMTFLLSKGYKICASHVISYDLLTEDFPPSKLTQGAQSKHFWRPASVVKYFNDKVVSGGDDKKGLDLACGAGRDSLYLALNGWKMTSVDSSEHALARVSASATRANLKISCIQLDLEKKSHGLFGLKQTYDVIVVVRYLHRPLLPLLTGLLNHSGHIVYQTFMRGCEAFGSPKNPRFLLHENELATTFSNFKVIQDKIDFLSDGRPVNSFIAQKIVD